MGWTMGQRESLRGGGPVRDRSEPVQKYLPAKRQTEYSNK